MEKRASNFEALRIFAIISILFYHLRIFNGWPVLGSFRNAFVDTFSLGINGVNLFVLITGWFMISGKFKIRSFLRVAFETCFYSWLILLLFHWIDPGVLNFTVIKKELFPLFYGDPWFVPVYLCLYCLIPFLNFLASHLTRKSWRALLIIGFTLFEGLPAVFNTPLHTRDFYSCLGWFMLLYLLAGYFRIYQVQVSGKTAWSGFVLILLCIWGWAFLYYQFHSTWIFQILNQLNIGNYLVTDFNSLLCFLFSLCCFFIFKNWNCPYLKWVNWISNTVFGIYLIPENLLIQHRIWDHAEKYFYLSMPKMILTFAVYIFLIFTVSSVLDSLRQFLFEKPFFKWFNGCFSELLNRIERFMNQPLESEGIAEEEKPSFAAFEKTALKKALLLALCITLAVGAGMFGYVQLFKVPAWRSGRYYVYTIRVPFKIEPRENADNLKIPDSLKMTADDWLNHFKDEPIFSRMLTVLQNENKDQPEMAEIGNLASDLSADKSEDGTIFLSIRNVKNADAGKALLNEIMAAYSEVFEEDYPYDYFHIQSDPSEIDSYWISDIPYPSPKKKAFSAIMLTFVPAFLLLFMLNSTDSKYRNFSLPEQTTNL